MHKKAVQLIVFEKARSALDQSFLRSRRGQKIDRFSPTPVAWHAEGSRQRQRPTAVIMMWRSRQRSPAIYSRWPAIASCASSVRCARPSPIPRLVVVHHEMQQKLTTRTPQKRHTIDCNSGRIAQDAQIAGARRPAVPMVQPLASRGPMHRQKAWRPRGNIR